MHDILKMIHFDYCISEKQMKSGMLFLIPILLFSLFLKPVIAVLMIPLFAIAFLYGREETVKADFRRGYGILPVSRSSITRAAFIEVPVSAFAGEVLSLLTGKIALSLKLYERVVALLSEYFDTFTANGTSENADNNLLTLNLMIFLGICLLFALFHSLSNILGSENDIKIIFGILFAAGLIAVLFLRPVISGRQTLPQFAFLHPVTFSGRLLLFLTVHLLTAAICVLLCEITVRVTKQREF